MDFKKEQIENLFSLVHKHMINYNEDIIKIDFNLDEWKRAFVDLDFICFENTRLSDLKEGSYVNKDERLNIFKKDVHYIDKKIGYESLEFSGIQPSDSLKNKDILKVLSKRKSDIYIIKYDAEYFIYKDYPCHYNYQNIWNTLKKNSLT